MALAREREKFKKLSFWGLAEGSCRVMFDIHITSYFASVGRKSQTYKSSEYIQGTPDNQIDESDEDTIKITSPKLYSSSSPSSTVVAE
jgi:hypothetical protein